MITYNDCELMVFVNYTHKNFSSTVKFDYAFNSSCDVMCGVCGWDLSLRLDRLYNNGEPFRWLFFDFHELKIVGGTSFGVSPTDHRRGTVFCLGYYPPIDCVKCGTSIVWNLGYDVTVISGYTLNYD